MGYSSSIPMGLLAWPTISFVRPYSFVHSNTSHTLSFTSIHIAHFFHLSCHALGVCMVLAWVLHCYLEVTSSQFTVRPPFTGGAHLRPSLLMLQVLSSWGVGCHVHLPALLLWFWRGGVHTSCSSFQICSSRVIQFLARVS